MLIDNLFTLLGITVIVFLFLILIIQVKELYYKFSYFVLLGLFSFYLYLCYEISPQLKLYLIYLKPLQSIM